MDIHTTTPQVTATTGEPLLRSSLKLDSLVTGANGIAYVAGVAVLDEFFGLSSGWLLGIGAFLIAFAAEVWLVSSRPRINRTHAGLVAEANVVWAVASVLVVAFGWLELSTTGQVWALMQAAVVGGFAALQFASLRRG